MSSATLKFSFETAGIDRSTLLVEAAELINQGSTYLGREAGQPKDTEEAKLIRGLKDDIAELPRDPAVFPITDESFLSAGFTQVPLSFRHLAKNFRFFWVAVPVGLMPRHNWAYHRLELRIDFNKDETTPNRRPKAHQIFPEKLFTDTFKGDASVALKLNSDLGFTATVPETILGFPAGAVAGHADLQGEAALKASLTTGLSYRLKKAKIDHNSVGMEWVFWRLDGAEFFQADAPRFVIVLRVPPGLETIKIDAELRAYRYFAYLNASLQEAVLSLPATIRDFFEGGLPVTDKLKDPWIIPVHQ